MTPNRCDIFAFLSPSARFDRTHLLQNSSSGNQRRNVTLHLQHHPLDVATDSRITVSSIMLVSSIAIVVYVVLNSMREALQIYQQKWKYLFEPNNLVSWMLYISATLMVSPVFNDGSIDDVHFSATSLTVFLSWFNLLLFLQRFDQVIVARRASRVALIGNLMDYFTEFLLYSSFRLASMWSCFWKFCRPSSKCCWYSRF